jgi:hypothetical protein
MTTRRRIYSTLPIRGVGFQHRTCGEKEHWQNLGMNSFLQFK